MRRVLMSLAVCGALATLFGTARQAQAGSPDPGMSSHLVPAWGQHLFRATFYGGETARVLVRGDRSSDLDLYVYDENGHLVASDTDLTDQCLVSFTPRWTGLFYIKIVNRGGVANLYRLLTN